MHPLAIFPTSLKTPRAPGDTMNFIPPAAGSVTPVHLLAQVIMVATSVLLHLALLPAVVLGSTVEPRAKYFDYDSLTLREVGARNTLVSTSRLYNAST